MLVRKIESHKLFVLIWWHSCLSFVNRMSMSALRDGSGGVQANGVATSQWGPIRRGQAVNWQLKARQRQESGLKTGNG